MNHRQGVLIMSSAIGLATIAVAIDYTRHPLPEPEPMVQQSLEAAPCGLDAPCGLGGETPCGLDAAPCSLDSAPCSLDAAPCSLDSTPCGLMQSPCDLG